MSNLMRAAILKEYGLPLEVRSVPVPKPGPGQILIRLAASGVCHTDVHIWHGQVRPPVAPDPFILGHEGVGVVAGIGAGVTDWNMGDWAGAAWLHDTCGVCDECRSGNESFCQTHRAHGLNVPGTFAEYVVADAAFAVRLPSPPDPSMAPLMCAGVTAYGAIQRAGLQSGECCAVFGCGGLGAYAVQIAARMGADVIAVDSDPLKLAHAGHLGARQMVSGKEWPATPPAHVVINFAPTPATWPGMIAAIRPRGRIVAAAMVPDPVPLNQEWLTATGVSITGTSVGTRRQMEALMQMHAREPLEAAITQIALDDVTDALIALDKGTARGRFCVIY
jgi:propanol-preferring alcohol dehydrogenase